MKRVRPLRSRDHRRRRNGRLWPRLNLQSPCLDTPLRYPSQIIIQIQRARSNGLNLSLRGLSTAGLLGCGRRGLRTRRLACTIKTLLKSNARPGTERGEILLELWSSMKRTWHTLKRSNLWCVFPLSIPGRSTLVDDWVAQVEGQTSISNNAYEGRSEIFVRKSFTLWRRSENSEHCPKSINFQVPFSAIGSRRVGVEQLPPSYVCELGQGGRIVCSYSMQINVSQKSRHGFWTNRNR